MNTESIAQDRKELQENYRSEHKIVAEGWKFFASLRFIVAAFAVALQSALFTFYNQALKDGLRKEQSAFAIAFVGMYTIFGVLLIERRTIKLLIEIMRRGTELEFGLGTMEGFFHRLMAPELAHPRGLLRRIATHTGGLMLVYISIFMLWIYFFTVNLIKLIK